jgi:hypothetical protein
MPTYINPAWEYYQPEEDDETPSSYRRRAIASAMFFGDLTPYNYRTVVLLGECVRCRGRIVAKEDSNRKPKYCTRACYFLARFERSRWATGSPKCIICDTKLTGKKLKYCNRQCSGIAKRRTP